MRQQLTETSPTQQLTPADLKLTLHIDLLKLSKKNMKIAKLLFAFVLIGAALLLTNCGKKCKGQDPQARIINNGTKNVSVQIKTTNGNTVSINNVDRKSVV